MIFAVDGGGTTFKTCLVDDRGALSEIEAFPLRIEDGVPGLRASLNGVFQRRRAECEERGTPIRAIGIGCRGIIDSQRRMLLDDSGVMNFFAGHSFRELIDSDLPFGTENDAVSAAMGENKYGAGRRHRSFFLLTLGTGVGGGVVFDGRILKRSTEMGHFPVNPFGDICGCGNVGCIEAEFSASAFRRRLAEYNRSVPEAEHIRDITELFDLARDGHSRALMIVRRGATFLARGISGYSNCLDVERCILAGGIAQAGEFLLKLLRQELEPVLWRRDVETFVEFSELRAQMGLYGAGAVGAAQLE